MKVEKCKFGRLINAYLDDELSGKKQKALVAHLKKCALCNQELNSLRNLNSQLASFEKVPVPKYCKIAILNNARDYEASRAKQPRFALKAASLAIAASIIISLAGGTLISRQIFEQREKENYEEVAFAQESFYLYFEGE